MKNGLKKNWLVILLAFVAGQQVYGMEEGPVVPNVTNLREITTVALPKSPVKNLVDVKNPWAFLTESYLMQPLLWTCGYAKKNPGKVIVGSVAVGAGVGGYLYLTKDIRKTGKLLNDAKNITCDNEGKVDDLQVQALENMSLGDSSNKLAKDLNNGSLEVQKSIHETFNKLTKDVRRICKKERESDEEIRKSLNDVQLLIKPLPTQGQLKSLVNGVNSIMISSSKKRPQSNNR